MAYARHTFLARHVDRGVTGPSPARVNCSSQKEKCPHIRLALANPTLRPLPRSLLAARHCLLLIVRNGKHRLEHTLTHPQRLCTSAALTHPRRSSGPPTLQRPATILCSKRLKFACSAADQWMGTFSFPLALFSLEANLSSHLLSVFVSNLYVLSIPLPRVRPYLRALHPMATSSSSTFRFQSPILLACLVFCARASLFPFLPSSIYACTPVHVHSFSPTTVRS